MADKPTRPQRPDHDDERIDEASDESFPASDPPAWSAVDRTGKPEKTKQEPRREQNR